jgi:hypothetical protein
MIRATTKFSSEAQHRAKQHAVAEDEFIGQALAQLNHTFPQCDLANQFSIERVPCRYSKHVEVQSFLSAQDNNFSAPLNDALLGAAQGGRAQPGCKERLLKSNRTAWRAVPEIFPPLAVHQMLPWVKEWMWGVWRQALVSNLRSLIEE